MDYEDRLYKQHYACFHCRKVFKKAHLTEIPRHQLKIDELGRVVHCPQCDERMPEVGFDFEAPKQTDIKAWAKAQHELARSLSHAIRNSRIVNTKTHKVRDKFIQKLHSRIILKKSE